MRKSARGRDQIKLCCAVHLTIIVYASNLYCDCQMRDKGDYVLHSSYAGKIPQNIWRILQASRLITLPMDRSAPRSTTDRRQFGDDRPCSDCLSFNQSIIVKCHIHRLFNQVLEKHLTLDSKCLACALILVGRYTLELSLANSAASFRMGVCNSTNKRDALYHAICHAENKSDLFGPSGSWPGRCQTALVLPT
jgi:hypothetical protein